MGVAFSGWVNNLNSCQFKHSLVGEQSPITDWITVLVGYSPVFDDSIPLNLGMGCEMILKILPQKKGSKTLISAKSKFPEQYDTVTSSQPS